MLTLAMSRMRSRGLIRAGEGNASIRHGSGMYITRTFPNPGPPVYVHAALPVPGKASSEWRVHLILYAMNERINAVLHHHQGGTGVYDPLIATAGDAPAGTMELAENVSKALGDEWDVYVPLHGMFCTGPNLPLLLDRVAG